MKILQHPVSDTQKSAMFYYGAIATAGDLTLETFQDGEVTFEKKTFVGSETPKLAKEDVHDFDLEAEVIVDIFVDKFFTITKDGKVVDEDLMLDDYDEAMDAFVEYIK